VDWIDQGSVSSFNFETIIASELFGTVKCANEKSLPVTCSVTEQAFEVIAAASSGESEFILVSLHRLDPTLVG
jgi:hypothetical protein